MQQVDLWEICSDILRQMYAEAEPPLDFDDVLDSPKDFDSEWYTQHTLSQERQNEIVQEHVEQHDLSKKERTAVMCTTILDLGPASQ